MMRETHICWGGDEKHGSPHILKVENVSFNYTSVRALQDVSFEISCGHTLAVMGPNGAGKSTLINLVAGLLKPAHGHILWDGRALKEVPNEVAYLPQRSNVDWTFPLTVRSLVEMGRYPVLGVWKKFSKHDDEIVNKAIEMLGLNDFETRQIGALSGGQQQRVFLARALAQEAHLLLLDEPFSGLDTPSSEMLGELISSLAKEGRLIVVSHHDLNSAGDLFDTLLLLNQTVRAFGNCRELVKSEQVKQTYGK